MKRVISLFLILLLVVSSVPSAFAYTPGNNWCINCPVAPDGMGVLCAECMMCPHCEGCICVEENDYSAGTKVEYDAEPTTMAMVNPTIQKLIQLLFLQN